MSVLLRNRSRIGIVFLVLSYSRDPFAERAKRILADPEYKRVSSLPEDTKKDLRRFLSFGKVPYSRITADFLIDRYLDLRSVDAFKKEYAQPSFWRKPVKPRAEAAKSADDLQVSIRSGVPTPDVDIDDAESVLSACFLYYMDVEH